MVVDLLSNIFYLVTAIVLPLVSFGIISYLMPKYIRSLKSRGKVVKDFHKPGKPNVPRPAGPILLLGIASTEVILYILTLNYAVLAILLTTVIGFIVGIVDDRRVMPGWFKPLALVAAAIPIILLGAHSNYLNLVFGSAFIPILYIPLILITIPVVGNTINSIDVLNGVASISIIIALIPILASVLLFGNIYVFLAGLPLLAGTIAFYRYHRYPSKVFPGDSGTLLMGTMLGAIAIAGRSEIIAIIALLPAVMNSFLFLSSMKKIVEHREVKARPTILTDDFRLMASKDRKAPVTLLRLILADGPLTEKEIIKQITMMAIVCSVLAFISIYIQSFYI
ncbi:MAG TPA: UDP-N-acetylglucosamine-1-phosphate transferase [Nitrososphaeraceae archaeon]|jgi:UDP-N-acetylglucosamine--dolichyl-phosphate N-acetylglucosaminephosphotransferase|nr:UDP-N-acetylglucosamine-1-phosphate transferase [Nitrososphaeraceae archaeon]